jgi:tRNA pseudouridine55 synthase
MALKGVLVIDKPAGPTSHDIVDRVRRLLRVRKVGHTGTLDPFATGVLVVCVGKATRLARFLAQGDKVYRATVRFGFATSTDDCLGEPLAPPRAASPQLDALKRACEEQTGELDQLPPAYSAKRVEGRRLYELARAGITVERARARVTVHSLEVVSLAGDQAELEVRCSGGTYIRAIARDLGEGLGTGAHLTALRRTRAGEFGLEAAVEGGSLTVETLEPAVLPMSGLLSELPALRLNADGVTALSKGRDLDRRLVAGAFPKDPAPRVRAVDARGELLGLAVPRGFGFEAPGLSVEPVFHPDVVLVD